MAPGQNAVVKESLPASSVEVPTGCLTSEPPIKEKHFVIDVYESARGKKRHRQRYRDTALPAALVLDLCFRATSQWRPSPGIFPIRIHTFS